MLVRFSGLCTAKRSTDVNVRAGKVWIIRLNWKMTQNISATDFTDDSTEKSQEQTTETPRHRENKKEKNSVTLCLCGEN